jgi:EAL domain-containing protein (putative c-di-GMP-specific phosphodiesterase class I)
VKIAQDFVREIATDQGSATIVRATIALARELGMVAIAEGVESPEQFELLKAWGCSQMQGFYFAKPLGPEDILPLLRRGKIRGPLVMAAAKTAA